MPRTSIIMPNYNGLPWIKDAIASVQAQTDPDWELLCVDNGSDDGSIAWLRQAAATDRRIRVMVMTATKGPAHARNHALRRASGRYIAFLDSDDIWMPNKLARQIPALRDSGAGMCCSWYHVINGDGQHLADRHFDIDYITRDRLLGGSEIGCLTVIYDRLVVGSRQMANIGHEDYALWLDILEDIPHALVIQEDLAGYRVGKSSVSSSKMRAAGFQWQVLRQHVGLTLPRAGWYFMHYAGRALWNRA